MNRVVRTVVTVAGLIALWQAIVWISGAPPYLLPSPLETAIALTTRSGLIAGHALVTLSEILAGLVLGTALGVLSAVVIALFRPARRWLMPLLVTSQAIPVFAIAPLLVLCSATGWPRRSGWRPSSSTLRWSRVFWMGCGEPRLAGSISPIR